MELFLPLKPDVPEKLKTAQSLTETQRLNFAGKYVNGPQVWEIIVKEDKLFYKQADGDLELKQTGAYRLSFGANLENDLVFVANSRGEIEYVFDGLYSAKKMKEKKEL
jgi:hypothetical protein